MYIEVQRRPKLSAAPDGEQLADDYEELGGGRCAVM